VCENVVSTPIAADLAAAYVAVTCGLRQDLDAPRFAQTAARHANYPSLLLRAAPQIPEL
jgi:hypothetical protein